MNTIKKMLIVSILLSTCAVNGFGADNEMRRPGRGHNSPPPEAYTACEGKSAGDTAEFVSPHGDTVTGVCVQQGDRLVLHPDSPPPRRDSDGRSTK